MDKKYLVVALAAPLVLVGCQNETVSDSVDSKVIKVKLIQVYDSNQTVNKRYSGTVEESTGSSLSFRFQVQLIRYM